MDSLRHLAPKLRALMLIALALCLGVRLLTPAGFMPSIERGTLSIVPCPDGDGANLARFASALPSPAMTRLHADHGKQGGKDMPFHHQSCPYAAAASLAGLVGGLTVVLAIVGGLLLPHNARALPALFRQSTRDRPPLRAPPFAT